MCTTTKSNQLKTGFHLFKLATATKVEMTVRHQLCVMEVSIIVYWFLNANAMFLPGVESSIVDICC